MQPGDGGTEDDPLFAHQNQDFLVDKLAGVEREHARLDASADTLPRMGMRMDGLAVLACFDTAATISSALRSSVSAVANREPATPLAETLIQSTPPLTCVRTARRTSSTPLTVIPSA